MRRALRSGACVDGCRRRPTASTKLRGSSPSWPSTESLTRGGVRAVRRRRAARSWPSLAQPSVDVVMAGVDPHRDVDLFVGLCERDAESDVLSRDDAGSGARVRARRRTLPSRSDISFADYEALGSRRRGSSRSPSATTATREQPRCSCRRWRSESRWSSRGRRRSRADTASSTATTAGSSSPETQTRWGRSVAMVLSDEWYARALGARARRTVEEGLTWGPVRRPDRVDPQRRIRSNPRSTTATPIRTSGTGSRLPVVVRSLRPPQ